MAPAANIDIVEASESSLNDLSHASNTAATLLGASVVSQSWGLLRSRTWQRVRAVSRESVVHARRRGEPECHFPGGYRRRQRGKWSDIPFNLTIEHGCRWNKPVQCPGDTYETESVWSGGGGGPSDLFPLPVYQQGVSAPIIGPLTVRTSPDISAVEPVTAVSVYEPELYGGWVGGRDQRGDADHVGHDRDRRPRTRVPRWPDRWAVPARRCRLSMRPMSRAMRTRPALVISAISLPGTTGMRPARVTTWEAASARSKPQNLLPFLTPF